MVFSKFTLEDISVTKEHMKNIDTLSYYYKVSNAVLWRDGKEIYISKGKYGMYEWYKRDQYFLLPLSSDIPNALEELKAYTKKEGIPFRVCQVPGEYLKWVDLDQFHIERDRGSDEYIYDRKSLETLRGKKLQAKRNHISKFESLYPDFSYKTLDESHFDECLKMLDEWLKDRDESEMENLDEEYDAILKAFESWTAINLTGSLLREKDKIIAFTIGETIDDETIIHFEKGNRDYQGSYAAINKDYLTRTALPSKYVNRQEDLNLEGLRQAKESYKPIRMVEKYTITA